jgi:8-oxo-dGTP pyrophosphatase MutT (NUDIX family)
MIVVRVYGILVDKDRGVLVSDELIRGGHYTKFCGGGLEKGEGTLDCLKREFMEEMGLRIEVMEHIYTTDFYQQSAFHPDHQILSIYYKVNPLEPIHTTIKTQPFDFDDNQMLLYAQSGGIESFRFVAASEFSGETLTLPIDKLVADLVKEKYL